MQRGHDGGKRHIATDFALFGKPGFQIVSGGIQDRFRLRPRIKVKPGINLIPDDFCALHRQTVTDRANVFGIQRISDRRQECFGRRTVAFRGQHRHHHFRGAGLVARASAT